MLQSQLAKSSLPLACRRLGPSRRPFSSFQSLTQRVRAAVVGGVTSGSGSELTERPAAPLPPHLHTWSTIRKRQVRDRLHVALYEAFDNDALERRILRSKRSTVREFLDRWGAALTDVKGGVSKFTKAGEGVNAAAQRVTPRTFHSSALRLVPTGSHFSQGPEGMSSGTSWIPYMSAELAAEQFSDLMERDPEIEFLVRQVRLASEFSEEMEKRESEVIGGSESSNPDGTVTDTTSGTGSEKLNTSRAYDPRLLSRGPAHFPSVYLRKGPSYPFQVSEFRGMTKRAGSLRGHEMTTPLRLKGLNRRPSLPQPGSTGDESGTVTGAGQSQSLMWKGEAVPIRKQQKGWDNGCFDDDDFIADRRRPYLT